MIRMCRVKNNTIYDADRKIMVREADECLVRLHNAKRDNEGRIQCFDSSLNIFVTGKAKLVKEYGKYVFKEMRERNCNVTDKPCEMINTYAMVIFDFFDCDREQTETLEEYLRRHRGVSLILLPFSNYSDTVITGYGDGYYLQLGKKPKVAKVKDF